MILLPHRRTHSNSKRARERNDRLRRPDHHMVTLLLLQALSDKAEAICFGFHPGIEDDPEYQRSRDSSNQVLLDSDSTEMDPARAAVDRSAFTRGPAGEAGIPISMRVNGNLRYFGYQLFNSYGMILKAIQFRPVAIGASPESPKPLRYIDLPDQGPGKFATIVAPVGKHQFAEVDFEFQLDNTFWIYVRGVRCADAHIRVSDTVG